MKTVCVHSKYSVDNNKDATIIMSIQAFDDLLNEALAPFVQLGAQIGGLVGEQVMLVKQAFDMQRGFIEYASRAAKPANDQELLKLLKPTSNLIIKIQVSIVVVVVVELNFAAISSLCSLAGHSRTKSQT